jgi:hypothetical protein
MDRMTTTKPTDDILADLQKARAHDAARQEALESALEQAYDFLEDDMVPRSINVWRQRGYEVIHKDDLIKRIVKVLRSPRALP